MSDNNSESLKSEPTTGLSIIDLEQLLPVNSPFALFSMRSLIQDPLDLIKDPVVRKELEKKLNLARKIHQENLEQMKLRIAISNAKKIWFDKKNQTNERFTQKQLDRLLKERIEFRKYQENVSSISQKRANEQNTEKIGLNKKHKSE